MTDKELMQQALEALESLADTSWSAAFKQRKYDSDEPNENVERERVLGVITALRERLAQPEPAPGYCPHCKQYTIEEPMRREWVGLTQEEVYPLANAHLHHQPESYSVSGIYDLARAIEAKLKEKNA